MKIRRRYIAAASIFALSVLFCGPLYAQEAEPGPETADGESSRSGQETAPDASAEKASAEEGSGEDASAEESGQGYRSVEGLETWHYDFDLEGYEAGKYNIIIKGTDRAGNEYIEGPFNILVDPESDKPVVNISNPEPRMRVGGKLNIIGTCVDDDAVARVEVQVDDGPFVEAEGTEFWSYYLDTEGMEDGEHSITARGIDVNGVIGENRRVAFVLDQSEPVTEVTSFSNGALLNGKVRLEGSISDLNGIEELELSTDGGESFEPVSFKSKRRQPDASFSLKIDTRELEDGPQIYWFRSTDRTGSVGVSAFLFFVDNRPPELEIIYPEEDESINGIFTVVGRVSDEVGIDTLSYRRGREEPVEIPISTGDPYWSQEFDFSGEKKTDIRFILTDTTGNSTEYRLNRELDSEADKPTVEVLAPKGEVEGDEALLAGYVYDDDAVKEIVYRLDKEEPVSVPAEYSFSHELTGLGAGEHELELYAVDVNGVAGDPVELVFTTLLAEPEIRFESLTPAEGDGTDALQQGMEITAGVYEEANGTILFHNPPDEAFVRINGSGEDKLSLKKTDREGERRFSFSIEEIGTGYTEFSVEARDDSGRSTVRSLYLVIAGPEGGSAGSELRAADYRFDSGGSPREEPVHLSQDEEIVFSYEGGDVRSAQLQGGGGFLEVEIGNNRVILRASSDGYTDSCSIDIETEDGRSFTAGPFSIGSDSSAPELTAAREPSGFLVQNSLKIEGGLRDATEVRELSYSLNEGQEVDLPYEDGGFAAEIDLAGIPDGPLHLVLRAADVMGNEARQEYFLKKDTEAPRLLQLTPRADLPANGQTGFIGKTEEENRVASVEFTSDGETFEPVPNELFPTRRIDLISYDEETTSYAFRLTDAAGNSALHEPRILIDAEGDRPTVQIQLPVEGELVQQDFTVSGMAFDDDEVARILYRLDDEQDFTGIDVDNSFEIPLSIDGLDDNEHRIEIKAVDIGGVESELHSLNFVVSKSEPRSRLDSPAVDTTVRGTAILEGESSDENGIGEVLVSFDNGNTFNAAEIVPAGEASEEAIAETEEPELVTTVRWRYSLETDILADGTHSIIIKAVDNYGVESLYTTLINIDNTPPEIELSRPFDGMSISDLLDLEGRVNDNIELAELKVELQQLEASEEPEGDPQEDGARSPTVLTSDLSVEPLLIESLELAEFDRGWINLRITAIDRAGNVTTLSRDVEKITGRLFNSITLYTPAAGSEITGEVSVQGRIVSMEPVQSAQLFLDGRPVRILETDESGYFSDVLTEEDLEVGEHRLQVSAVLGGEEEEEQEISTDESLLTFRSKGPWVKIESFRTGEYVTERPWLTGTAGYEFDTPELEKRELKEFLESREVEEVEVSLDNGRTFRTAKGREEWKFRLETQELPDGELWMLVRARFNNGETAVAKSMVVVDETPPRVNLISPSEGVRVNETLSLSGTADDAFALEDVSVALRKGDKNRYQVPSFIQGLYIDTHVLGATYAEIGVGLTFFDDNVKLQVQAGLAPPGRFTGTVAGVKLLANVAVFPYDYFLGYDWRHFSSSLAVGAVFNYFTMEQDAADSTAEDEQGLVLGALIGQLELIKAEIPDWNMFSTFSLYTEGQLWFISSDVSGGVEGRLAFGIRTNVF